MSTEKAVQEFAEALSTLRDAGTESISTIRNLHTAFRIALQAELTRLTDRYGGDDIRTVRMKSRLQANSLTLRALELAAEKSVVRIAIPVKDEVVIEGRVTDEKGRGLEALIVALVDEKGNRVRVVEPVTTEKAGYFGVRIAADVAKKLKESHPGGILVAVLSDKGKTIHVVDKLLALEPGKVTKVDVVLRRSDFPVNIKTGIAHVDESAAASLKGRKSKSK